MQHTPGIEQQIHQLLGRMTIGEKIGQMCQTNLEPGETPPSLRRAITDGRIGSVLNDTDVDKINELQRVAVEESRLGIPLLVGRDVIHGFKTIFPLPLGQAASWNPEVVREGARIAAMEAAGSGINWTFAPMIDISRDPRWGRIAETLGEDPFLASTLGTAMIEGFQGDNLSDKGSIAATAKHFAGYGAAESGRDYATANIPENELRNVYLPPFKAAAEAGIASFMTSFSDLNGVPASGNEFLLKQVLREEWQYRGLVVSDWLSIEQLTVHGLTANAKEAAFEAANAGVDMEMVSTTYADNLEELIREGRLGLSQIDEMVANILRIKFRLGLFANPYTQADEFPLPLNDDHRNTARDAARQSVVLLKNERNTLPLKKNHLSSLAVIGPLADDPYEQLGTWIFDGDPQHSVTALQAIRDEAGSAIEVRYARALQTTRSKSSEGFSDALAIARKADASILFLGEESILSGEAHSRADINLPGIQQRLVDEITALGKPVVLVIMAGRPLTIQQPASQVDALLYAWHPGTMGGPAIADLLFGNYSPSAKLPVTFPRMVGQIPIYYSQKNGGKPPTPESVVYIDDIEVRARQTSLGNTSFHLDAGYRPLYPFGHGLSYSEFRYTNITVSSPVVTLGGSIEIAADLTNVGTVEAEEVAQLYIRDLVASVTRPVRELKGFRKIRLHAGESRRVSFKLDTDELAFFNRNMQFITEPGRFHAWIGGSSEATLQSEFEIVE